MKFWKNRKGNIAVMTALILPVVVGGAGFGVETGYWYYTQLKLQQAADAAVYAAALELHEGNTSQMLSSATAAATLNGYTTTTDTISEVTPSATYPTDVRTVDVSMTRSVTRGFSAIFNTTPVVLHVKATAKFDPSTNACTLALAKSAANSVWIHGNGSMNMTGCIISSNSISNQSIVASGSSTTSTPCIMSAGGVNLNANVTLTSCSTPVTNLPPTADPYKDVPLPSADACQNFTAATNSAGTFCNSNININKSYDLGSGTYIFNGSQVTVNGGGTFKCTGCTFVFLNGATITMNGNPLIQISAPTSGTYSGMLFMGDRTGTPTSMSFAGDPTSYMTGTIYFPNDNVVYAGNFSGFNGCTQVVGYTIEWTGNTNLKVDCSAYGMGKIQVGGRPYLVG